MTLEVRKARVVEADLPSVIAQSANGELVANLSLPSGSGWGPFKYTACDPRDLWDLRWRKDDGEFEHVKMISSNEKWLLNLKLTSDTKLANSQLLVDTSKQVVFCDIIREIKRGEVVINIPKISGSPVKETSPTTGYTCPYCGIAFTKHTTLQAHVTQYCRKRPSQGSHIDGAPMKRSRSESPQDEHSHPVIDRTKPDPSVVAAAAAALAPCAGSHGLSPTMPVSPTLPTLNPLKYCVACRLFFANEELFQMHLRLGANLSAVSGQGLVMSAPVITSSGLQYIPVHGASFTPPPHPTLTPHTQRGPVPVDDNVAIAAANGLGDSRGNSPNLPLDLSFRTNVGPISPPVAPASALHCIKKAAAAGAVKRQLSEAELAAIPRPFQCQFCQTRFRSHKTLKAHQESYCQGNSRTGDNVSMTRNLKSRQTSLPKTSIANVPVTAILPTLAAQQLRQLGDVDMENFWHQTEQGFRCFFCGYVGQTVRGMKLHCKLHRPPPSQVPLHQSLPMVPLANRSCSTPEAPVHTPTGQDSGEVSATRGLNSDGDSARGEDADSDHQGAQENNGPFSPQPTQMSPALAIATALKAIKCQECDTFCVSFDHLYEHMKTECPHTAKMVKKEADDLDASE